MTETRRREMPLEFRWCYEPVEEDEAELCEVLLIGEPEDVTPLHIGITNILEEKTIAIIPVEGVTEADSTHYHFELRFNSGILADLEQISVESDGWSIQAVSGDPDSLYLLWIGEDEITLNPPQPTEIILTGLAAKPGQSKEWYKRGVEVLILWQFDNIEVRSDGCPSPNPSQEYYKSTRKEFEMVKATGKSNIPLFVGFVNCNKVINTNNVTNSLQLRLTNTNFSEDESSNITFKYNDNPTDASELQVVLEVGTEEDAPWALGSEDEVNGISIQILGGQWRQNGEIEQIKVGSEVKALRWTFIPKEEDVVLTAQDTMLIEFGNIVTNHPTGEANLYLNYKKVEGYKDGKFICQIEKAPVAYDEQVGIGTTSPNAMLDVKGDAEISSKLGVSGNAAISGRLDLSGNAAISGKVGIGAPTPTDHSVDVKGNANITGKLDVSQEVNAEIFQGKGALVYGMIVMWYGEDIPTGWVPCDGTDRRAPDLTGRYIRGAFDAEVKIVYDGVEDEKRVLTKEMLPAHNHKGKSEKAGKHNHGHKEEERKHEHGHGWALEHHEMDWEWREDLIAHSGEHSHSITITDEPRDVAPLPNPMYAALRLIMYVGNEAV